MARVGNGDCIHNQSLTRGSVEEGGGREGGGEGGREGGEGGVRGIALKGFCDCVQP